MTRNEYAISVCPWLGDKTWVYSITFDEALSELQRFSIPILEEFGVPGHLEVVVGQIGQVRQLGQSSYNGMHHMGADELREMLDRGWGVGCHSWSHTWINAANVDRELGDAKQVLEEAIGEPITVYCAPGDNSNMNQDVLKACNEYGYLGAMALVEALNRPDDRDMLWLNRTFLHQEGPITHDCEFDPFRKIQHARRDQGWIIDYCHCPLEEPVHPRKDCSASQLRERVDTVTTEGGSEVWLAKVEDAMDYRYTRRHLEIDTVSERTFNLTTPGLPRPVRQRVITLELPATATGVDLDGSGIEVFRRGTKKLVDVDVSQDRYLHLYGMD